MNELTIFESQEFGTVRTTVIDGEPWFVAADVCKALEIANSRDALSRIDDDEKGVALTDTLGGKQEMSVVNEAGLYALVLGSRKPEAKAFKRWITHEVLPSIRKNGMYAKDELLDNPDLLLDVVTKLKAERELRLQREAQVRMMKPKAEYFDALVDRRLLTNFRTTAKELNVPERWFMRWLAEKAFVYTDKQGKKQPYAQHVKDGLFYIKDCKGNKSDWAGQQTYITVKGKETFRLLLEQERDKP